LGIVLEENLGVFLAPVSICNLIFAKTELINILPDNQYILGLQILFEIL
jgi:hypothetical protein